MSKNMSTWFMNDPFARLISKSRRHLAYLLGPCLLHSFYQEYSPLNAFNVGDNHVFLYGFQKTLPNLEKVVFQMKLY